MTNSFGSFSDFQIDGRKFKIARLEPLEKRGWNIARLPFALRILLENLLRCEDGSAVRAADIEALARWDPKAEPEREIAFTPGRVLLQDFTGVPAVVDLAAMRAAMVRMGGDPKRINPLQPAELVIDHSVQVDVFGSAAALQINSEKEFERNRERYAFLRWGQQALANFKVVPPATGIVHQVNLEYLARVVMTGRIGDGEWAYPDTLVGTDSHTTMINGLGVLGWGVGGIEAEAALLGQPVSMLIPQVVGFRLTGELREGATATDLVLRVTEMLRAKGVVGKFVEFYGPGLPSLQLADRATIANMSPEYGATCGIFPVDQVSLGYLAFTGRPAEQVRLVEAYMKEQGLFHTSESPAAEYSDSLELDLGTVEPSLAGPRRPQDRIRLSEVQRSFHKELAQMIRNGSAAKPAPATLGRWESEGGDAEEAQVEKPKANTTAVEVELGGESFQLDHGAVVIAAITSCTNTSNPSVMLAAGLLARKAVERGLTTQPWVKTSLAPGSKVVTDYLQRAGLMSYLEKLGFNLVGYGCTTCIGNSGPLPEPISQAITKGNLAVAAVLSGNRNFEGRIHSEVRANYLASPPLVVAYALAGTINRNLYEEPLGHDPSGAPVYLKDLWPSQAEILSTIQQAVRSEMFQRAYANVFAGEEHWNSLEIPAGDTYEWAESSTYVREPPYFVDMPREPEPIPDLQAARVLALFGDSITTDHISPAGAIKPDSPAGRYLQERGVGPKEFNSYGSRRGNHEVMMRGTFANVRLRNRLVPGVEGGVTLHLPDRTQMSIYDAAMQYRRVGTPLVILAGKEYGSGSSRDWAAKGPRLLGVRAVLAESYERIHRSNLVGMGILPLQFRDGESVAALQLSGTELYDLEGLAAAVQGERRGAREVTVRVRREDGSATELKAKLRIDTPQETLYFQHGGILHYVLRRLLASPGNSPSPPGRGSG